MNALAAAYRGRRVLVTGHTGFKGSWLVTWLRQLGAQVTGYSLAPPTTPAMYDLLGLDEGRARVETDVRDAAAVQTAVAAAQPEIVFHLAAQPLVLRSLTEPALTLHTNAGGTINVLEAIRHCPSVKAAVFITSDKCYRNMEWHWGYREHDTLGGDDPYSASKAMAELAIATYRASYFRQSPQLASVRAGNVIGGGDFAANRLVPDCMKALAADQPVAVRRPASVRPWLLVLEPLSGYLWLGAQLLAGQPGLDRAFNFGPREARGITALEVAQHAVACWGSGTLAVSPVTGEQHEMGLLRLNWDLAAQLLGWQPVYDWQQAVAETVAWFQAWHAGRDLRATTLDQIAAYTQHAATHGLPWAQPKA